MLRVLSFAFFLFTAQSAYAVIADCAKYFGQVTGRIEMHMNEVIELQALVEILTEKSPKATSPHTQNLRSTMARALHRLSPDDTMESLAADFMRSVRYMPADEMSTMQPAMKSLVEMLKVWDTKYPPKLVQAKLWPALKSLEDLEFTGPERKAFNKDIEMAYAMDLSRQVLEAESRGGSPDRPAFQHRVDQGYRPRAGTGTTGNLFRNGPREEAPPPRRRP
jgi:hypothetical protein